jgi:hypothetical protein
LIEMSLEETEGLFPGIQAGVGVGFGAAAEGEPELIDGVELDGAICGRVGRRNVVAGAGIAEMGAGDGGAFLFEPFLDLAAEEGGGPHLIVFSRDEEERTADVLDGDLRG